MHGHIKRAILSIMVVVLLEAHLIRPQGGAESPPSPAEEALLARSARCPDLFLLADLASAPLIQWQKEHAGAARGCERKYLRAVLMAHRLQLLFTFFIFAQVSDLTITPPMRWSAAQPDIDRPDPLLVCLHHLARLQEMAEELAAGQLTLPKALTVVSSQAFNLTQMLSSLTILSQPPQSPEKPCDPLSHTSAEEKALLDELTDVYFAGEVTVRHQFECFASANESEPDTPERGTAAVDVPPYSLRDYVNLSLVKMESILTINNKYIIKVLEALRTLGSKYPLKESVWDRKKRCLRVNNLYQHVMMTLDHAKREFPGAAPTAVNAACSLMREYLDLSTPQQFYYTLKLREKAHLRSAQQQAPRFLERLQELGDWVAARKLSRPSPAELTSTLCNPLF